MYNKDQKQRFLDWAANNLYEEESVELVKKIFISTELEEDLFGKDVSEFTDSEVYDLLLSLNSKSRARLKSLCAYMGKYYEWCKFENIVSSFENPFDRRIVYNMINKIIPKSDLNDRYFSKETLLEYIDIVPDPHNKFLMYAVFHNIQGEAYSNLINLKVSDFDEENKQLKLYDGRVFELDQLFIKLIKDSIRSEYYYKDGERMQGKDHYFKYVDSPYIFKPCGFKSKKLQVASRTLWARMETIKEQTENQFISLTTLYKNGLLNFIKEKCEAKGLNFKTAILCSDKEMQGYIEEFGLKIYIGVLKLEVKDYLHLL